MGSLKRIFSIIGTFFVSLSLSSCNFFKSGVDKNAIKQNSNNNSGGNNTTKDNNTPDNETKWVIRWCNHNGVVEVTDTVLDGEDLAPYAEAAAELLKRAEDSNYTYTFARWDPYPTTATSNMKFIPIYASQGKELFTYSNFEETPESDGTTLRTCSIASYNRSDLTTVEIPNATVYNGRAYKINAIGNRAFENNGKLETVRLNSYIQTIGDRAFYNCTSLRNFCYDPENTGRNSILSIGEEAFANCSSLFIFGPKVESKYQRRLEFPTTLQSIGKEAFSGCSIIESVFIPPYVTNIGKLVFKRCTSIEEMVVDERNPNFFSRTLQDPTLQMNMIIKRQTPTEDAYVVAGCKRSIFYNNYETVSNKVLVATVSSSDAAAITTEKNINVPYEIKIPDNVFENINFTTISNGEEVNRTSISFGKCYVSVGTDTFSNENNSSTLKNLTFNGYIKEISANSFNGCPDLTSFSLQNKEGEDKYTSWVVRNGSYVDISAETTDYMSTSYGALIHLDRKTFDRTIIVGTITDAVDLTDEAEHIGYRAFYKRNIVQFKLNSRNLKTVGEQAFAGCTLAKNITLMSTNTDDPFDVIPDECFADCVSLEGFQVSVEVRDIRAKAFAQCSSLQFINFSYKLNYIRDYAFNNCSSLNRINFAGTAIQFNNNCDKGNYSKIGNDYFYRCVTSSKVSWTN